MIEWTIAIGKAILVEVAALCLGIGVGEVLIWLLISKMPFILVVVLGSVGSTAGLALLFKNVWSEKGDDHDR